jgi:hypothetical protein
MDPSYGIFYRLGGRRLSVHELVEALKQDGTVEVERYSIRRNEFMKFEGLRQQKPRYVNGSYHPYVLDGYGNIFARKSIGFARVLSKRVYFEEVSPVVTHGLPIFVGTNMVLVVGFFLFFKRVRGRR